MKTFIEILNQCAVNEGHSDFSDLLKWYDDNPEPTTSCILEAARIYLAQTELIHYDCDDNCDDYLNTDNKCNWCGGDNEHHYYCPNHFRNKANS